MQWSISLLEAKTMTEGEMITGPHYALNINSFTQSSSSSTTHSLNHHHCHHSCFIFSSIIFIIDISITAPNYALNINWIHWITIIVINDSTSSTLAILVLSLSALLVSQLCAKHQLIHWIIITIHDQYHGLQAKSHHSKTSREDVESRERTT